MGSALSTQERLFVSQQWEALLGAAMHADSEPSSVKAKEAFYMSFDEWQALLSLLETGQSHPASSAVPLTPEQLQRVGGAASAVCHQLSRAKLHCPLVSLAAHAFALWCGAVDVATFRERLMRLEVLVSGGDGDVGEAAEWINTLEASSDSGSDGGSASAVKEVVGRSTDDDISCSSEEQESKNVVVSRSHQMAGHPHGAKPMSRRDRLMRVIKQRVTRRSGDAGSSTKCGIADDAQAPPTLFLEDVYRQVEPLFRNLANELLNGDAGLEMSRDNTAATAVTGAAETFHSAGSHQMFATFGRAKKMEVDVRPVGHVALCVALALYAALAPPSTYAVEGVLQLRRLDRVMRGNMEQGSVAAHDSAGSDVSGEDSRVPVTQQWPWVATLEARLVHKQHVLDVEQCVGEDGQQLARNLLTLCQRRTADHHREDSNRTKATTAPGESLRQRMAHMTPEERWNHCRTQYIGQRHVWGPLLTHFLSADIFDADKPTVLVFFGPSGYGKSEMAKQVASAVHGFPAGELEASGKMVYLHMPSFSTKESVYSLVDPPAAHVGDGILLSALHAHPDAVVVLDEFEKSTAEAVQHVWLSAFQKGGVLRSLKRAERSVSTVHTTFILTCNTCAAAIENDSCRYLAASETQRARMREGYEAQCRDICRAALGDPFVNRVDGFFAFTPYSREERQEYVELTLERLLAAQRAKGRHVRVTPRCVAALAAQLRTFHASTLEDVLRPLFVEMARKHLDMAVLTVEARAVERLTSGSSSGMAVRNTVYVLLPCREVAKPDMEEEATVAAGVNVTDIWEQLPQGPACLAMWDDMERGPSQAAKTNERVLLPVKTAAEGVANEKESHDTHATNPPPTANAVNSERETDVLLAKDMDRATERELTLVRELQLARELLAKKDVEIARLKKKVRLLERLLGVMMCFAFCCSTVVAILAGLKLTIVLLTCTAAFMALVLKLPLRLLLDALGALFRFLGPATSAILVLCVSLWIMKAGKSMHCP